MSKKLKKLTVIVNINLAYTFEAKNAKDAIEKAENVELPSGYVENSFEIVKVVDENDKQEELSCRKCGKIISENAFDKFSNMCGTCWAERN